MKKPFVVALEGIPGSGKTTLRKALFTDKHTVERVEQILPDDQDSDIDITVEGIIASDFLKTERAINSVCDIVVFDRYYLSTLVYQESYDKIHNTHTVKPLTELYEVALADGRLLEPDITVYIDTPLRESFSRKQRQSGDELWVNEQFLQLNREIYSTQVGLYIIDGRNGLNDIKLEIEELVERGLKNGRQGDQESFSWWSPISR